MKLHVQYTESKITYITIATGTLAATHVLTIIIVTITYHNNITIATRYTIL